MKYRTIKENILWGANARTKKRCVSKKTKQMIAMIKAVYGNGGCAWVVGLGLGLSGNQQSSSSAPFHETSFELPTARAVISRLLTIKESAALDRSSMSLPQLIILIESHSCILLGNATCAKAQPPFQRHTQIGKGKILFVMIFGRARKVSASQS